MTAEPRVPTPSPIGPLARYEKNLIDRINPISGASMNPARTFGPDLASTTFTSYWVYIAGPLAGAVLAVGIAFVLRGRGGGKSGAGAAQGDLFTEVYETGKS